MNRKNEYNTFFILRKLFQRVLIVEFALYPLLFYTQGISVVEFMYLTIVINFAMIAASYIYIYIPDLKRRYPHTSSLELLMRVLEKVWVERDSPLFTR